MKMTDLEQVFKHAIKSENKYVAVKIGMKDFPADEIIINPAPNFQSKLEYYKKTYDENCVHKFADGIAITGAGTSDSLEDIVRRV